MDSYLMPAGYGEAEYIEKKSRFISRVWPIESEADAIAHIEDMRKKHYDATHNVYAYILRENGIMRYSDDGEPGGTSGQPTLNVFRAKNIQNVCCVVTRYFGGILLGSGGLVRAYSNAARMAMETAGICRMAQWKSADISCSYSQYEKLRRILEGEGALIEDIIFGADVTLGTTVMADYYDDVMAKVVDFGRGTIGITPTGDSFRGVEINE